MGIIPESRGSVARILAGVTVLFVEDHDEAAKRRVLDDLYARESSALPAGAASAQARVASEWDE